MFPTFQYLIDPPPLLDSFIISPLIFPDNTVSVSGSYICPRTEFDSIHIIYMSDSLVVTGRDTLSDNFQH